MKSGTMKWNKVATFYGGLCNKSCHDASTLKAHRAHLCVQPWPLKLFVSLEHIASAGQPKRTKKTTTILSLIKSGIRFHNKNSNRNACRPTAKRILFTFYHHWTHEHDTGADGDETRFLATQHVQYEGETITKRCFIADTEKALSIINNRNILFKFHDDHIDLYVSLCISVLSVSKCADSTAREEWEDEFENNSNRIAKWSMFEVVRIRMPPKSIASFLSPVIIHIPSDCRNDRNIF